MARGNRRGTGAGRAFKPRGRARSRGSVPTPCFGGCDAPSPVIGAQVHPPPASVPCDPSPAPLPPALTTTAPHCRAPTTAALDRSRARPRLGQVHGAPHAGADPTPAPFSNAPGAPTGRTTELRPPDRRPLLPCRFWTLVIGYTRTRIQTLAVYWLIARG